MPFPGEPITAEPNSGIQTRNAQLLAEEGGQQVQAPSTGGGGWPGGMGPQPLQDVAMGLPSHLTQPGSAFVPSPEDRDPNHGVFSHELDNPQTAPTAPDAETRKLMLSPADSDLQLAGKPDFLKDDDDGKNEGEDAKTKCPKCDAMNAASAKECRRCKASLVGVKGGNFSIRDEGRRAKLYQMALAQDGLRDGVESDGLIWKIACKSGTLALSPGPGNVAVDKPLHLTGELFRDMVLSLQERAFPYTTVPETHNNGSLENTGYVRDAAVLTKAEALLDQRISPKAREAIAADPEDTEYLLAGIEFTSPIAKAKALEGSIPDTSIGVKFGWRNTRTGKAYRAAWEHLALTPMPWVDGLPAFGMSADGTPDPRVSYDQYDEIFVDMPEPELDLAIRFDPDAHPRDWKGRFRAVVAGLKTGESVELPDGVTVTQAGDRFKIRRGGNVSTARSPDSAASVAIGKTSYEGGEHSPTLVDALDKSIADVDAEFPRQPVVPNDDDAEEIRDVISSHIDQDPSQPLPDEIELPGDYSVVPDKFGTSFTALDPEGNPFASGDIDEIAEAVVGHKHGSPSAPSSLNPGDTAVLSGFGLVKIERVNKNGDPVVTMMVGAPGGNSRKTSRAVKWAELDPYRGSTEGAGSLRGLAQDGAATSTEGLTLSNPSGELDAELQVSHRQENPQMARTVEELLASQQVDLEQAQAQIAALSGQLQLAQGTITSQGEQLHMDAVRKRIESLEGKVSPSLALAAKTVMEADKSRITGEGGLNLSITAATTDENGEVQTAEKVLKSPTDVVEYMLSAAATEDGDIATRIAGVQHNIGLLQLSAHQERTAEDEAKAAVEANERQRHPERFKDNGKGDRIA